MTARWRRIKRFLFLRVLHADDEPHALAMGFAIGLFVAMTPTIGAQMVIAASIAAAFRANKLISAVTVWISNPVTMLYIYYVNWRIGQHFVKTSMVDGKSAVHERIQHIIASIGGLSNLFLHVLDRSFWSEVLGLVWSLGVELWIGSFMVGAACALPGYFLSRWAITVYRQRRPRRNLFRRSAKNRKEQGELPASRPELRKRSA